MNFLLSDFFIMNSIFMYDLVLIIGLTLITYLIVSASKPSNTQFSASRDNNLIKHTQEDKHGNSRQIPEY